MSLEGVRSESRGACIAVGFSWTTGSGVRCLKALGVANKYNFQLRSEDRHRPFPHKVIIGQGVNESVRHVGLKFLAYVLFFHERIQIETEVQDDSIPFVPDLAVIGYDMRPALWVECGECTVSKLHKLAVKCPEAALWVVKRSRAEADHLLAAMEKEELRRGRYGVVALDPDFFQEFCGLIRERNEFHWFDGGLDVGQARFEFNGLWFDIEFEILRR